MNSEPTPILCPICNFPICTGINYNCEDECIGNSSDECLHNISSGHCRCNKYEIRDRLVGDYPHLFKNIYYGAGTSNMKWMIAEIRKDQITGIKVICQGWETCKRPSCQHNKPHEAFHDGGLCTSRAAPCDANKLRKSSVVCIPYQVNIIDVDELFEEIDI